MVCPSRTGGPPVGGAFLGIVGRSIRKLMRVRGGVSRTAVVEVDTRSLELALAPFHANGASQSPARHSIVRRKHLRGSKRIAVRHDENRYTDVDLPCVR